MDQGPRRAARAALELYPRGFRLLWVAPAVLALVALPEFAQHVVEIQLGMFDSRESFRALQLDPTRMAFGVAKVAGLMVTMLAAARLWWTRDHDGRWWDLRGMAWGRFLAGLFIFFGIGSLPELLDGIVAPNVQQVAGAIWAIVLLPFLFLMLAGLFGDRSARLRDMLRRSWPWLLLTAALVVMGFAPVAWLHQMNHQWAMGAAPALLWALMIFDSLLVGLLAGLTGTAFYLGYAAFAQGERSTDPI